MEGQINEKTGITKLIVTFHDFSKAPNKIETYA